MSAAGTDITATDAREQQISIPDGSKLQWLRSGGRIDFVADARRYLAAGDRLLRPNTRSESCAEHSLCSQR